MLPNIFVPLTLIEASEVNANFQYVLGGYLTFFYEGTNPPASNQLIIGYIVGSNMTFPANMALSTFYVTDLPTAPRVFSIQKNHVEVATLTVQTDGSYAFAGGAWSIGPTDIITIVAPAITDVNMNRFFGTLRGQFQ